MANTLLEKYKKEIAPALKEKFNYSSTMQIHNNSFIHLVSAR